MENLPLVEIDASTFQQKISKLAETVAQKVKREGQSHLSGPIGFQGDIFITVRQARNTYDFLYWTHSDELRSHYGWRDNYIVAAIPLVRTLIDNLFNVTLLLLDPTANGERFRVSGLRKDMLFLDALLKRYSGIPIWDKYITESQQKAAFLIRQAGYTEVQVRDRKKYPDWPTLGRYIAEGSPNQYKSFWETFSYGPWKQYSAIAHGGPEGLHEIGSFLNYDGHPHDERSQINEAYPRMMSYHIMHAAIVLLSIITEIQGAYKFRDTGARINERIAESWQAILPAMEAKEIYDLHYQKMMKDTGIIP
jgi:hypothetical protein